MIKFFQYEEDIVYHYCSLESLYDIIKSREIWLTSLQSSNDVLELKYGEKLFLSVLTQMVSNESDKQKKGIYNLILKESKEKSLIKETNTGGFYSISFVSKRDSLTHWSMYGKKGTGVAIGINKWMFKRLFDSYAIPNALSTWLDFQNIIYSEEKQKEYIEGFIKSTIDYWLQISANYGTNEAGTSVDYFEEHPILYKGLYYSVKNMVSPIMKHHGFIDESELRLYIQEDDVEGLLHLLNGPHFLDGSKELMSNLINHLNQVADMLGVKKVNKQFALINGSVRSYFKLDLSCIWSNALITEVILGSKCYQNKKELKDFLNNNGLKGTKLSISKIPLR